MPKSIIARHRDSLAREATTYGKGEALLNRYGISLERKAIPFLSSVLSISEEAANRLLADIRATGSIVRIAVHAESLTEGTFTGAGEEEVLRHSQDVLTSGFQKHLRASSRVPLIVFFDPQEPVTRSNDAYYIETMPGEGALPGPLIHSAMGALEAERIDAKQVNSETFLEIFLRALGVSKVIVLGQFLRDEKTFMGGCVSKIIRGARAADVRVTLSRFHSDDAGKNIHGEVLRR